MNDEMKLFAGNANRRLAGEICARLKAPLGRAMIGRFADGECRVKIEENARGKDCFVLQPTAPPVNDHLMELLIMVDALRRASARRITAVMPYYGYARQDKKDEPRVPISAKLVANLITAAGADRVLTIELHAGQIQGFFDIPVDHLYANPVMIDYFKKKRLKEIVGVSPDAGGAERARAIAKRRHADMAIVDKRRPEPNRAAVMNVVGDVKGKTAILVDDLIDTAGTVCEAARAIRQRGARAVYAFGTHGVLSGPAVQRLNEARLDEVVLTNTVDLDTHRPALKRLAVLSVAPILAAAIRRIHREESVSQLFV